MCCKQVWHFQNEIKQMDAHYRRELDTLAAQKAAAEAEVAKLRLAAPEPAAPQPVLGHPLPLPAGPILQQPPPQPVAAIPVPLVCLCPTTGGHHGLSSDAI
jgi:hypothetical protein